MLDERLSSFSSDNESEFADFKWEDSIKKTKDKNNSEHWNEVTVADLAFQAESEKGDMLKEFGVKEGLSELEINRVEDFTLQWLDTISSMQSSDESIEDAVRYSDQLIYLPLAEIVGETEKVKNRQLPQKFKLAAKHFLSNLLVELQSELSNTDKKITKNKISVIHNILFSYSPNISNFLNNRDLLILTTESNRVPELQGWLGADMAGELVYEWAFNYNEEHFKKLAQEISEMSIDYALDSLSQIETIGANSLAQGDWARQTYHHVHDMLVQISESEVSPLLKMQAHKISERLAAQVDKPTNSVITFLGNKSDGRIRQNLDESVIEQHERLLKQIDCQNYAQVGYLIPVAKDALGMFDHAGIPREISYGTLEDLPEPKNVAPIELTETILSLQERDKISPREILNLVNYINNKFYSDRNQIELVKIWSGLSKALSLNEWQRFLISLDRATDAEQKYNNIQNELQNEAGEKNLKASKVFLNLVYSLVPRLLESDELPPRSKEKFQNLYSSMHANKELGFDEFEFQDAEAITSQLKLSYSLQDGGLDYLFGDDKPRNEQWSFSDPEIGKRLVAAWEFLKQHHENVFLNMKKKLNNYYYDFTKNGDASISKDIWVLNRKSGEFKNDLIKLFEEKKVEAVKGLAPREFQNINSVVTNELVNPFKGTESENLPLLLQSLYEPDLRKEIESRFHIELNQLMLREQIQLLKFIAMADNQDLVRLEKLFSDEQLSGDQKVLISKTFFSCGVNSDNARKLLDSFEYAIGQDSLDELQGILVKYKELTDVIDSIEEFLAHVTVKQDSNQPGLRREIVKKIASQANRDLFRSLGKLKKTNSDLTLESGHVKADLLLFKHVLQVLSSQENFSLEQLQNFTAEAISNAETKIPSEIKQQIEDLFIENKKLDPEFKDEKDIELGIQELRKDLSGDTNAIFHTYSFNGKIIGYFKTKQIDSETIYAGSLNVDPNARGIISEMLVDELMEVYGQEYNLMADALEGSPSERWYIQKFGFQPTGKTEQFGSKVYAELKRMKKPIELSRAASV